MTLYPLLMAPAYRCGSETPWGGSMLSDAFMKDLPEQTGESLEISTIPGKESMVRTGAHAAKTLTRMVELWGEALLGDAGAAFPLLLKLIDAAKAAPASVSAAQSAAWVILNCDPDAQIICGTNDAGEAVRLRVRPGDVYYLPKGTLRGVGAGVQLYEISQSEAGDGIEAAIAGIRPEKLWGATSLCRGGSRTHYIADAAFELCRLNVSGKMPLNERRMLLLMPLAPCALRWNGESVQLMPFDSVVVPAALEGVSIESEDCKVLMACVSDRPALREALGYRAENVAGLID